MNITIELNIDVDAENPEEAEQKANEIITMMGHPINSKEIKVNE
jgi:hypothetical protein